MAATQHFLNKEKKTLKTLTQNVFSWNRMKQLAPADAATENGHILLIELLPRGLWNMSSGILLYMTPYT